MVLLHQHLRRGRRSNGASLTYDNARVLDTVFAGGVRTSATITDVADVYAWSSYVDAFDAEGVLSTRTTSYDDGRGRLFEYENGSPTSTTLLETASVRTNTFSDDFEDGVLNDDGWVYLNTVSEFDGSLYLEMTVTDQRSRATVELADGLSSMTLSYDAYMHPANAYFYGENTLEFTNADGGEFTVRFNPQRTSWAPSYDDDPDNFDLPRLRLIDPDGDNTSVFSTGSNTSTYFDDWTRIEIEFDSEAGTLEIDMESDGALFRN